MEDSGFQLVSRKKAARVPKTPSQSQLSLLQDDKYEGASTSEILTRISELKQVPITAGCTLLTFALGRN